MQHRVLLVDDDLLHLSSAQEFLQGRGFIVDTAPDGDTAIALVMASPHVYSLVILDYRMHGRDGAATVEALTQINPDLYTLIFSGDASREAVLKSTRQGARGFVDKAEGAEVFFTEVLKWCKKFEATQQTVSADVGAANLELLQNQGLVGKSESLLEVARTIETLRTRNGSVLILGESGTGKELIARALHNNAEGPFFAVNCGIFAANPQLMSSTLFGHKKGAFTGAHQDKKGILEEAEGGTVFLDEIYALPLVCQIELLRVLQERVVTPVGSGQEIPVKFRLIAAAKPDLIDGLKREEFKLDLFYRISRTILSVPPLRERAEDIAPLVEHFCAKWSRDNGERKTFLARTLPYLESYPWPGNVRELENVVYSLLDISPAAKISPEHLDAKFFENAVKSAIVNGQLPLKDKMNGVEKNHLVAVLGQSESLREASRKMKVSLTTVLRLLKKHKLDANTILGHDQLKDSLRNLRNRRES